MQTDKLTSNNLRQYIPNVLTEVAGETPLADKLAPFIDSARIWLETEYLGPDDFLSEAHNDYALRILVAKAMADAVPSLDLVVTPTGMAVVNTDSMAPASKERVERLINSLREQVRKSIPNLIRICNSYSSWRTSERGLYFRATFIRPSDVDNGIHGLENVSYEEIRLRAISAESKIAERYLGRTFLNTLRNDYNDNVITREHTLVSLMLYALMSLIVREMPFDQNRMWHAVRPIISELKYYPNYETLWLNDMGGQFNNQGFVNDIKGGFYF